MNASHTLPSPSYARMLIVSARNFRLRQAALTAERDGAAPGWTAQDRKLPESLPAAAAPLHEGPGGPLQRQAIMAARQRAIDLRSRQVIGEEAYRLLIHELDRAELAAGGVT